jgi:FtsP/CotA-like multicopper oxidase with cupredoxin domain
LRLSRRRLLRAAAGALLAVRATPARSGAETTRRLTAEPARAAMVGDKGDATSVWAYNGTVPGPVLRLKQGEATSLVVTNRLAEDTTVHWHGIRLPNAMDGVPGVTQEPIRPGESFTYTFAPPDAGTFWYHPHADTLQQLGRGLAGPLIVEEAEPPAVDRDLVWMLADWRLRKDAQIAAGFGNAMEAAMAGRLGNTVTLNGSVDADQAVRAGERLRLRLINASLARIMALRFEGHRPVVVAVDGQPCEPHEPEGGRLLLGPSMRLDVILDLQGEPGQRYRVIDDFYERMAYVLTHLDYDRTPRRETASRPPTRLPPNPLQEPEIAKAERHELVLDGGMMGSLPMSAAGPAWAINGHSMSGDGHAGMPPLLALRLGVSYVLRLVNRSAWWHPMHLHGHSFRLLSREGEPVPHRQWADTVLVPPRQTAEVAFVADNPGDWMLHCHVIDHQANGMMTVLRVA